jgi:hypothetical protein
MDRPAILILLGMMVGLLLFIGFYTLNFIEYMPLGIAFNNFFIMLGVILFFITGFFYASLKTVKQ